jgi:hypothetical protein
MLVGMSEWTEFVPVGGWQSFAGSEALTDALWNGLPADKWDYLNFVSSSSIWESRQDGSMVSVDYEGDRIVHFAAKGGMAGDFVGPLTAEFGLVPAV